MTMINRNVMLAKMGKYFNSIVMFLIVVIFFVRAFEGANESSILGQAPNPAAKYSDLFKTLLTGNLAALRQGDPNKQGPPPQNQYNGMPPGLDDFIKLQKTGVDTYLEPYWPKGEWVYQRPLFTPRPPRYLQLYLETKPEVLKECAEFCPRTYDGYGPLCAHLISMSTGLLKVQSFMSLCHMMLDNCISSIERHYNGGWQPMYQGNCRNRWLKRDEYPDAIASHAQSIMDALTPTEPSLIDID